MSGGGTGVREGMRTEGGRRALAARGLDGERAGLALRVAVATALAWVVVLPLGGVADEFPYYAPFGAVVAVTGTVAVSARSSVRSVAAILLGSAVALGFAALPIPELLELAVAVGTCTLLAGWTPVRPAASWVPLAAVFVLQASGDDPWEFATAYFSLTALGAVVGTLVDLAYPALPWGSTDDRLRSLRTELADQLDEMADALDDEALPAAEDWAEGRRPVVSRSVAVDDTVAATSEARRANWRARPSWGVPEAQQRRADTLAQVALLVQDLRTMLERHEHRDAGVHALGASLRWPTSVAMRAVAVALRSASDEEVAGDVGPDDLTEEHRHELERAVEAVQALEEEVRRGRRDSQADLFAASSAVTTLWRVLATLTPPALRDELTPGW